MAFRDREDSRWNPTLVVIVAALGCAGLSACGKGEAKSEATPAAGAAAAGQMAAMESMPAAAPESGPTGASLYQRCATCHQMNGKGMPGAFPPLAGSEWANAKDPAVPIRVVLHGLNGSVTVAGQRFNSAMPPYGTNQPLNDSAVAAVLTYVRSSWGNASSAVTPAEVAAQRAATATRTTPWTAKDLEPLLNTGR